MYHIHGGWIISKSTLEVVYIFELSETHIYTHAYEETSSKAQMRWHIGKMMLTGFATIANQQTKESAHEINWITR